MISVKELAKRPELLAPGHRLCSGCSQPIIVRHVLKIAGENVVVANATGCLEVATTIFPYTAWRVPWIHNAFENAAATASGIDAAIKALKRKGRLPEDKKIKVIAFGGDGGTYDIGLQSLSGALERGHHFVYILLDNEAYMNTGIQRSGATPKYAWTTTSPAGSHIPGKVQFKKDITNIVAMHDIPYAAQAALYPFADFIKKIEKALSVDGPAFVNVLAPCPRGWRYDSSKLLDICRLAVETRFWPLFEVENGRVWRVTYKPRKFVPVEEYLKMQGRYSHLFKPERREDLLADIQREVDNRWKKILHLAHDDEEIKRWEEMGH